MFTGILIAAFSSIGLQRYCHCWLDVVFGGLGFNLFRVYFIPGCYGLRFGIPSASAAGGAGDGRGT